MRSMTEWKKSFPRKLDGDRRMKDDKKFLSALGLCVRAGKVIFGVPQVCEAMRKGGKNSPVTVFEASDTSENTRKRISDKCTYYNIKHMKL